MLPSESHDVVDPDPLLPPTTVTPQDLPSLVSEALQLLLELNGKYGEIINLRKKNGLKGDLYWTPSEQEWESTALFPCSEKILEKVQDLKKRTPEYVRKVLKELLTSLHYDPPEPFLSKMDQILSIEKTQTTQKSLSTIIQEAPYHNGKIILWQGDICTLPVDAIVNAANEFMLGCFTPYHPCIDNAIHCAAGPRLRVKCREIMSQQGHMEPTGIAKITPAYHLPSKYILHTVGPIINPDAPLQPEYLSGSYRECLNLAKKNGVRTIAFCCISTGVFGYPNRPAAITALTTVKDWLGDVDNAYSLDFVIFNVFKEVDREIYKELLESGEFF